MNRLPWIVCCGAVLAALACPPAVAEPPLVGDWVISQDETYTNEILRVVGNVRIEPGVTLTLESSTVEMVGGPALGFEFVLEDGAILNLTGTAQGPAGVRLAPESPPEHLSYKLVARAGSTILGRHCYLLGYAAPLAWVLVGQNTGEDRRGWDGLWSQGSVDLSGCEMTSPLHSAGGHVRLDNVTSTGPFGYFLITDNADVDEGTVHLSNLTTSEMLRLTDVAAVLAENVTLKGWVVVDVAASDARDPAVRFTKSTVKAGDRCVVFDGPGVAWLEDTHIRCDDDLSSTKSSEVRGATVVALHSTFESSVAFPDGGRIEFRTRIDFRGPPRHDFTFSSPPGAPPQTYSGTFDGSGNWSVEVLLFEARGHDVFGWSGDDYLGHWRGRVDDGPDKCFEIAGLPSGPIWFEAAGRKCPKPESLFDVMAPSPGLAILLPLLAVAVIRRSSRSSDP